MKKWTIILFFMLFLLGACSNNVDKKAMNEKGFTIYTSIYPLQFIAEELTKDIAEVKSVLPPGVDAHTYEPTSKEMTDIAKANLFFYIGANMESFSETIKDALAAEPVEFIELGVYEELFIEPSLHYDQHQHHEHGEHHQDERHKHHHVHDIDPHFWLDPVRMIKMAEIMKKHLIEYDPEHENIYEENFHQLQYKLTALDEKFTDTLKQKTKKQFIASHAAYGYWEERYGIEQIPISGVTSSDEPSQKELVKIAKLAEEIDASYIVVDQMGANRLTNAVLEYLNAELKTIHHLETLTEEDIVNERNYFTIMEDNLLILDEILE